MVVRKCLMEVALSEAPLADIFPFQDVAKNEPTEDEFAMTPSQREKNFKQVKKFHNTPKFKAEAIKTYKNLSVPIHIVPAWNLPSDPGDRVKIVGTDSKLLDDVANVDPSIAEQLIRLAEKGDSVWIVQSSTLSTNNLPTPWMIVHAMFDDSAYRDGELYKAFREELELAFVLAEEMFGRHPGDVLTMKSARDNNIVTETDVGPEILCQAILTTKGFTYKLTGDPKIDEIAMRLDEMLKGARAKFESLIRGQIISINVARLW